MARLYQTAFWLLLVGIVAVHCYPTEIEKNESEETSLSSYIEQLRGDSDFENLDISVYEDALGAYRAEVPTGRVRRDKKLSGVEKKKAAAEARRRQQLRRAAELELALQRAREFQGYVNEHRQAGLSEDEAVLRAYNEHTQLGNQVLGHFNPNHDLH